jgi:SAM-dependent methyltransferase
MTQAQRSPERLRRHYEVEKALADRLRRTSSREERAKLYETMYDELFAAVPDHPRLTAAHDRARTERLNRGRLGLVRRYLRPDARVLDIGAGDCAFSFVLARRARLVTAVEISEGSAVIAGAPENFTFLIYDGFRLPLSPASIDLAFSDQLVEHLHLDDVEWHFKMIADALAPGGCYVFRTPHRFTGPHDVSRYFTHGEPEGFHMKEWTYRELAAVLRRCGYGSLAAFWSARGRGARVPFRVVLAVEDILRPLPSPLRRRLSFLPFPSIAIAARKAARAPGRRPDGSEPVS